MIAIEEYNKIPAVNWSSLKQIDISPLQYKHRLDNPEPQKDAFVLGGAFHCDVLEPEKFDARYAVFEGTRRGKKWDEWQAERPRVQSLKPDELKRVRAMSKAVRDHRIAAPLLCGGRREDVVRWIDSTTGLACKGRLDYLRPDFLIDLKAARNPAPAAFERAAFNFGYAAQCAFYHDGAITAQLIPGDISPYIIAVQNVAPYDVACYKLDAEALAVGRSVYQRLLRRLVECVESDLWPGVAPDLLPLRIPPWAVNQTLALEEEEFDV